MNEVMIRVRPKLCFATKLFVMLAFCGCQPSPAAAGSATSKADEGKMVRVTLRTADARPGADILKPVDLDPRKTAIVVVDMWTQHFCPGFTNEARKIIPPLNETLAACRKLGMQVVFASSGDDLKRWADKPQRLNVTKLPQHKMPASNGFLRGHPNCGKYATACMCPVTVTSGGQPVFSCRQIALNVNQDPNVAVMDNDVFIAAGIYRPGLSTGAIDTWGEPAQQELWNLCKEKGIEHLIYMGDATNMCVLVREFGLIEMKRLGLDVMIVRDLTTPMTYNNFNPLTGRIDPNWPDEGRELSVRYIEQNVGPSISRNELLKAAKMPVATTRPVLPKGTEMLMTPPGQLRPFQVQRVFTPQEVAAYKPIGASNCYRHMTLDWNWLGGDLNDYFKQPDPVALAEFCKEIHLDALILLAVSHQGYSTFPSSLAPQFPAIAGRDYYGEVIRECHKRNIAVLGYITLARNWWYDKLYPEQTWPWVEKLVDLNGPYTDYLVDLSQEFLKNYPVDGLRYDTLMQDPNSRNRWSKDKYRELYGEEIPAKWDGTNWRRMRDFQRWSTSRTTRMLTEGNKAVKPTIETWQNGFIQQQCFDENDLEAGRYQDVGYIENGDPFRQLLFMGVLKLKGTIVGHMFDMPRNEQRLCMALGARGYQFMPVNRTTGIPDNKKWFIDNVKPFYGMIEQIQPYLVDSTPVPYAGLLYAEPTRYRANDYNRDWYMYGILKPLSMSLLGKSRVMEFICNLDLPTSDYSHLPLMVVPETAGLTAKQVDGLRRYVQNGGQLVVAGEALRYDEKGMAKKDFDLAKEMGVSIQSGVSEDRWGWRNTALDPTVRATITAPAGKQTFRLWMRESTARVDQIVLTSDKDFVPAGPINPSAGSDKVLVIETEKFSRSVPRSSFEWKVATDLAGFSGSGSVRAMPSVEIVNGASAADTARRLDSPEQSPQLQYEINIPSAGTWYVWVRQSHVSESDDSAYVGLTAPQAVTMNFSSPGPTGKGSSKASVKPGPDAGWAQMPQPQMIDAGALVQVTSTAGQTLLSADAGGQTVPLLHVNAVGKGRIIYLATSKDVKLMEDVIASLAPNAPAQPDAGKQVILTRQAKQKRWVLHLLSDGNYAVDIRKPFASPTRVVSQYPADGWSCEVQKTDSGLRIMVTGKATDRLLVLE